MTTRFLQDIIRQPVEMHRTIDYLAGPGLEAMQQASSLIRSARDVVITGIGARWNAALSAGALFYSGGRPVYMQEAGELRHFPAIPRGAVIIAISRTGRSIEIVQLLAKAEANGAAVIGITNSADSPLSRESAVAIVVPTVLDHAISANTYSTLLITASALASAAPRASHRLLALYFTPSARPEAAWSCVRSSCKSRTGSQAGYPTISSHAVAV